MKKYVSRSTFVALGGAIAVSVSTLAGASTAHAFSSYDIFWYVENHGEGYDLKVSQSATYNQVRGNDTGNETTYGLNFTPQRQVDSACSSGDQSSPNFRTGTATPIADSDALDPGTHTFCKFVLVPLDGSSTKSHGASVASAQLTATTPSGDTYVIPAPRGSTDGSFNYRIQVPGGSFDPLETGWVSSRLGDTGGCVMGGKCGVDRPSWRSASDPNDALTVELRDQGDHYDLVWKVDWQAPKLTRASVADSLGAAKKACTITGTDGPDVITGTDGPDVICAGDGDDVINAGDGDDIVYAGDGDDTVNGGAGNDILKGGKGDDSLNGGAGNDTLGGGAGNDSLNGGSGDDQLHGATGQDDLQGGDGTDHVFGGTGDDRMATNPADTAVVVTTDTDTNAASENTNALIIEDGDGDGQSAGRAIEDSALGMM